MGLGVDGGDDEVRRVVGLAGVEDHATAGDHVVVTLDVGGATEILTFDARTLKPAGRLKFANEP